MKDVKEVRVKVINVNREIEYGKDMRDTIASKVEECSRGVDECKK